MTPDDIAQRFGVFRYPLNQSPYELLAELERRAALDEEDE